MLAKTGEQVSFQSVGSIDSAHPDRVCGLPSDTCPGPPNAGAGLTIKSLPAPHFISHALGLKEGGACGISAFSAGGPEGETPGHGNWEDNSENPDSSACLLPDWGGRGPLRVLPEGFAHRQGGGPALPSATQHSCCFPCVGSWLALLWEKGPPLSRVRKPHAGQLDAGARTLRLGLGPGIGSEHLCLGDGEGLGARTSQGSQEAVLGGTRVQVQGPREQWFPASPGNVLPGGIQAGPLSPPPHLFPASTAKFK